MKIKVLYEDSNILAIDKPSGLLVHGDGRSREKTLTDWILKNYPKLKGVGEPVTFDEKEIDRPGIVHRLDKDTDGLMIIAKSEKGLSYFKDLFDRKSQNAVDGNIEEVVPLHKYYRAVCELTKQGEAWLNSHPQVHTIESWINPKVNVFSNFSSSLFNSSKINLLF